MFLALVGIMSTATVYAQHDKCKKECSKKECKKECAKKCDNKSCPQQKA